MSVTIVTGTDTDVGKTVTTAALVASARRSGRTAYVIKPVQTGIAVDERDVSAVSRLTGEAEGSTLVALRQPLAPVVAARLEGTSLPDPSRYVALIKEKADTYDEVFVEGAGGVRTELGIGFDLLDLADRLSDSDLTPTFVVVVRSGLGTLNHSALTVDAILARGHAITGIVLGSVSADSSAAERTNPAELERITHQPILAAIPEGAGQLSPGEFTAAAPRWFSATQLEG